MPDCRDAVARHSGDDRRANVWLSQGKRRVGQGPMNA